MKPAQAVGVIVLLGLLCISVGVGLLFGYAWALIAWGAGLIPLALLNTIRRGPPHA